MDDLVKCRSCDEPKAIGHYYKTTDGSGIIQPCKECKSQYNREYSKRNSDKIRKQHRKYKDTPNGLWTAFRSHKKDSPHGFDISKESFLSWIQAQPMICSYCGLDREQSNELLQLITSSKISYRLQFDRMDSAKGYSIENITLACKICNEHKKDFFTYREFKEISTKYLGSNLLERFGK